MSVVLQFVCRSSLTFAFVQEVAKMPVTPKVEKSSSSEHEKGQSIDMQYNTN